MKRFYLYILMLIAWLISAPLSAAIWSPQWAWQKMAEHVTYQDHSTNCIAGSRYMLATVDASNAFEYYIYKCQNTEDNVGYLNADYFILDKVTITESASYTFSMKVATSWDYVNLRNAKVKVQLRDGTTSDSKVLCEIGEIDLYFNSGGSGKTKSLTFGSAATEGYICLTFTGEHIGSIYSCTFSNFSIEKETSGVPAIIEQPATSLNIDVDNVPTLNVTAAGESLSYSWYYQFPGSIWISLSGEEGSSFKPTYFYAGYKYKCVVSNPNGDVSTNTISVDSITLHGTQYPEGSGKYYATYSSSERFCTDAQTVAYKAVWDEEKGALRLVHVRQDDACVPDNNTCKGVLLESNSPDIVISAPATYTYTTDYADNALVGHGEYNKTISYVLGVKDGKMAMFPGTEDAIPFYETCYNSDGTEYPDWVELLLPSQYTIVFDKNSDEATGTMAPQTLFDDGNTLLFANAYTRTRWAFKGWSTSPTGETEYADKQLITTIPTTTDNTLTLYAQWGEQIDTEGNYIISNSDDWANFCQYVANTDNSINAKLTADITIAVTDMAGTSNKPYTGTFDGGGHVLTVAYVNLTADAAGPFRYTKGATIQDLTAVGTITTSKKFAGGLIGFNQSGSSSQTTILRCVSKVNIVSSVSGDGTHGGLVGVNNGDDMIVETCAFTGTLTQATGYTTTCCGGFVGWSDGTSVLRNCLLAASLDVDTDGSNTFVRNKATLTNCHYTTTLGNVPDGATSIADKNLSNGEALVSLGDTWAQILGSDDIPRPYRESDKETVNYIYNDGSDWVCEDFLLEDKKEVNIGLDFTAKELNYNRPFTIDDGYYTVYAPFAIPTTNGNLYACTGINAEKTEAEFTEVTSPEANTAYIFKPARTLLDLGSNVEVKKTSDLTSSTGYLRGVYSLLTFTNDNKEGCYGYAAEAKNGYEAGAFVKFGAGATVPAGRAYIYAPDVSSPNPLKVVINGETTSINLPISNTGDAPTYYNLSGQRVSNDYKGIVISNGKKTIRK